MVAAPTLTLSAGFPARVSTTYAFYDDAAVLYDGTSFYADDILHDITAYGRDGAGITITRGVTNIVTTGFIASAGVLQGVLDNRDRRFDPNYTSGPYVEVGASKVLPNVPVSLTTSYNSTTYPMFYGYAEGWPQDSPGYGTDQIVNLAATDATKLLANTNVQIVRPAEQAGERIQAVITASGYEGPVAIATGNAEVSAFSQAGVSAWSHIVDCVNAEQGDIFVAADGTLTFRSRDQILSDSCSATSQGTFGDAGTELRYSAVEMGSPPIVNRVVLTWSSIGAQVISENVISQQQNGLQVQTFQLPFSTAAQAQQYADWIIARYANPITTFASVTIAPSRGTGVTSGANNLLPQAFGRELGDRITVKRTPLGGGSRLSADCFIRGITHSYADNVWKATKFSLQDASWATGIAIYDGTNTFDDGSVYGF